MPLRARRVPKFLRDPNLPGPKHEVGQGVHLGEVVVHNVLLELGGPLLPVFPVLTAERVGDRVVRVAAADAVEPFTAAILLDMC